MGFMDTLKKATGLGLGASEHYERAFEKGVLMGSANYAKAIELFTTAAAKAAEAADSTLQARALANAALYSFVTGGGRTHLEKLRDILPQLSDLEQIGLRTETMPVAPLLAEVEARLTEYSAEEAGNSHEALAHAHATCAEAFRKMSTSPLLTYKYQGSDQHREQGVSRFFYHSGLASWNEALAFALTDPEAAAERMAKALNAFRQCSDTPYAERAQTWLTNCRQRRTCWMCHREFQGSGLHFRSFPASVSPYVAAVVRQLDQDVSTLDIIGGTLTLCEPCGSAVERVADTFAQRRTAELRSEVQQQLSTVARALTALSERVERVERAAHTH
jgi:hypothetical protein